MVINSGDGVAQVGEGEELAAAVGEGEEAQVVLVLAGVVGCCRSCMEDQQQ